MTTEELELIPIVSIIDVIKGNVGVWGSSPNEPMIVIDKKGNSWKFAKRLSDGVKVRIQA